MINKIFNIPAALQSLRPGAQWVLRGEEYSGLEWIDQIQTQPTESEIIAEIDRLKNHHETVKYQELRRLEYPPLSDLADAVYWQAQGDNAKMTAYLSAVQKVKDKYPRGV
jgi:hypothetical protein